MENTEGSSLVNELIFTKAKSCRKFKKTEVGKTTFRFKIEFEKGWKRCLKIQSRKSSKNKENKRLKYEKCVCFNKQNFKKINDFQIH